MVIKTENLTKTFTVANKKPGFKESLKSVFAKDYKTVEAVKNVNLQVERGEILGFMGPNGAGKSTIIKMLTGMLYPTNGTVEVLGINPHKDRKKLAFKIGAVFGQKSQLWFHLPPSDTFELLSTVYELDRQEFIKQRNKLVEMFNLESYLNTPVRKLSLGQRMKCEIAASLLHKPELIFLDEPTIGLDVVSKLQIREALKDMNKELGTTIFLTSHDTGDVESLCNRVAIVNKGSIIIDNNIDELKNNFLNYRELEVKFAKPYKNIPHIDGAEVERLNDYCIKVSINSKLKEKSIIEVLHLVMENYEVSDISIKDQSMEDIIRKIYTA